MMADALHVLLGGALVVLGVLASAVADRVRGLRVSRRERTERPASTDAQNASSMDPRIRAAGGPSEVIRKARQLFESTSPGEHDVIAALVASGYKRTAAAEAARGCSTADRATIEGWTAAALRRAGKGASS